MKTLTVIKEAAHWGAAVLLSWLFLVAGVAAQEMYVISDNATGGDCATIGLWDAGQKICTLTTDIALPVLIVDNGLTFNGNGHAIVGIPGPDGYPLGFAKGSGLTLENVDGAAVSHLTVENFSTGIELYGTTNSTITHNTLVHAFMGILLDFSDGNYIVGNDTALSEYGIALYTSSDNLIAGNISEGGCCHGILLHDACEYNSILGNMLFEKGHTGIRIETGSFNTVAGNDIIGCRVGTYISYWSADNFVSGNNFVDSTRYQTYTYAVGNTYAGNYWNDFDTEPEGCIDGNGDGICDDPYTFLGGEDASAWKTDTVVAANIEVAPSVIKAKSNAKTVTVYIEVPGYAPGDIVIASVVFATTDGYVWADETPVGIGDDDHDGIPDLMVKFEREAVMNLLDPGLNAVSLHGLIGQRTFEGQGILVME